MNEERRIKDCGKEKNKSGYLCAEYIWKEQSKIKIK